MSMIKASAYCAFSIMTMFFAVGFAQNRSDIVFSMDMLMGLAMAGLFVWLVSFSFCFVLLIPLALVFKRSSLGFSFVLFAVIGFYIPAWIGYFASTIPAHGQTPDLLKPDNINAITTIVLLGIIGIFGALSAWLSLKQDLGGKSA